MVIDRSHTYQRAAAGSMTAKQKNLTPHIGHVTAQERRRLFGHRPVTIWMTGLSGSGKSTLAYAVEKRLTEDGHACFVLDGDNVRHGLNRDLGFSADDRFENIRRVAEVARLMNESGLIVIASFISPYRADRANACRIIGESSFSEVYVNASLEACEKRDPKRLYAKARRGEIADFTGISAPYEPPEQPDLAIDSENETLEHNVAAILAYLKRAGFTS